MIFLVHPLKLNMSAAWRRIVAAAALCAVCAWPYPCLGALIVLKDSVEISTNVVLLGQIAEIDPQASRALVCGRVGPSRDLGGQRTVDGSPDVSRGILRPAGSFGRTPC